MPEPARRALLVATSQYLDPSLPNLTGAVNDATELAQVLADAEVGGFDVQTVLDRPAHEVAASIEEFLQSCSHRDLVLLYFTGHGIKGMDGALYFAAADTKAKLLRASAVAASWVNEALDACRSKRQMVLLDCCHSGAFARGIKAGGQVGSTEQLSAHGQAAGRGRVILTASDAIQFALERAQEDELVKSVFTTCVVRGLRTGDADVDGDGRITLEDLFEYVKDAVHRENPHQTPEMSAVALSGEFVIATNPHGRGRSLLPPGLSAAVIHPAVHIREQAVAQLRELLAVADDLELRQQVLQALALLLADDSRRVSTAASKALEDTDEFAAQLRPSSQLVRAAPPPPESTPPRRPPESSPPPPLPESAAPPPTAAEPTSPPPPAPRAEPAEPLPARPLEATRTSPPPRVETTPVIPTPVLSPPREPPAPPGRGGRDRRPLFAMTALIVLAAVAFLWFGLLNRDQVRSGGASDPTPQPQPPPGGGAEEEPAPGQPAEEPAEEPPAPAFAVGDLRWTQTTPEEVTNPGRVRAIMWHENQFVAVGTQDVGSETDALVLTSSDGQQWKPYDQGGLRDPRAQTMQGLAVGPNGMIAVGSEGVRPDQDAAVWLFDGDEVRQIETAPSLSDGHREMLSIVWDDDHFVAVGCVDEPSSTVCDATEDGTQRAAVWTSSDGRQWEEISPDQIEQGAQTAMRDIVRTPDDLLVAVGHQQSGDEQTRQSALWTSTDGGQHWEWIDLPQHADSEGQSLLQVAARDDGIVAGGYDFVGDRDAAIWYSTDGGEWETQLIEGHVPGHQVMEAITEAGDGFVGVGRHFDDGTHGVIWVSADGKDWTRQQSNDFPGDETVLRAAGASDDRVIAGGGVGAEDLGRLRLWTGTLAE